MVSRIPIFDTLTHPTLNRDWIVPKYPSCADIKGLVSQMYVHGICGAFAVGMQGIGGYDEDVYIGMISKHRDKNLYPVAFYSFVNKNRE